MSRPLQIISPPLLLAGKALRSLICCQSPQLASVAEGCASKDAQPGGNKVAEFTPFSTLTLRERLLESCPTPSETCILYTWFLNTLPSPRRVN